jgi:ABC-type multidrug transport system fused ATPase/permease subunit
MERNTEVKSLSALGLFREVLSLLTRRERFRVLVLVLLSLFTMLLEIASVGLVVPVAGVVVSGFDASSLPVIGTSVAEWSDRVLLVAAMSLLLGVFVVKNLVIILGNYIRSRILLSVNARLTTALFVKFLEQPYLFHLRNNSAELVQATQNIATVTSGSLVPALMLIADVLVSLGVVALMVAVEPIGSLVTILLFGTVGIWLVMFTRARVERWGNDARVAKTGVMQALLQGFGGIKEIKILGRSSTFVKEHQTHLHSALRSQRLYSTFTTIPRSLFEILAVMGLVVLVSLMAVQARPSDEILPVLALFAAGTFRVLPSITRIVDSISQIRFAGAMVDQVRSHMQLPEPGSRAGRVGVLGEFHRLELTDVSFSYGLDTPFRLGPISIAIGRGEYVGLVGESGSGKSTLVDLIGGLVDPIEGAVRVNGMLLSDVTDSWQSKIGYVPQTIFLTDDSIRSNVALGIPDEKIDDQRVSTALEAAQLMDFCLTLPNGVETLVGERGVRLSGGQRQRIGIARALYHEPDVLLLDEATSALDIETEREVMVAVNALKGQKTVIIVAHRLSTVEQCDRLYRLAGGKVIQSGSFKEVSNRIIAETRLVGDGSRS